MKWIEITIYTTEEATEALADYLHRNGAGGVSIEESGSLDRQRDTSLGQWYERALNDIPEGEAEMKAYFATELGDIQTTIIEPLREFVASFPSFGLDPGKGEISWHEVDEDDWANNWKQYYKPVRITDRLTIKPIWESYEAEDGEIVVELDPGMAFGTGTHPSTFLILRTLERNVHAGDKVIDVGTGSGILAIAAAKLGASQVLALDLDPVAVSSTRDNVQLNGLEQIIVRESDLLSIIDTDEPDHLGISLPVDLVVSNILAEIIVTFIDDVHRVLTTGGHFIASGIIKAKEHLVTSRLESLGFAIEQREQEEDWVALVARKLY